MKSEWLIFDENESLILFCSGWGMDTVPFRPLQSSNHDVLFCYDYSVGLKDNSVRELAEIYKHIYLICWSMGVPYGQLYFSKEADVFTRTIAINGTLHPVDNELGIPEQTFQATLDALDETTLIKFYRRMCSSDEVFEQFIENKPERTIIDLREELSIILQDSQSPTKDKSIFSDIFISLKDYIIPTKNQNRFWEGENINYLPGGHFPFYLWKSWDQIVEEECQKVVDPA